MNFVNIRDVFGSYIITTVRILRYTDVFWLELLRELGQEGAMTNDHGDRSAQPCLL